MPTIRLQFSARDSVSSDLIRACTHGQWSHVDAITEDGRLLGARTAPVDGIAKGAQIRPFDYLPFSATEIVTLETKPDIATSFWNFLMQQVGKPYDESAYASFILYRDWRKDNAWCCTELIARAMEVSGLLKYPLVFSLNRIAPTDLILVLSVLTHVNT